MVGVTALLVGYVARPGLARHVQRRGAEPALHDRLLRRLLVRRRLHRLPRRLGHTAVTAAINVIQIGALLVFSVMAIGYRMNHPEGSRGWTLDPDGNPINVDPEGRRQGRAGQGRRRQFRRGEERRRHRQAVHDQLRAGAGDADDSRPGRSQQQGDVVPVPPGREVGHRAPQLLAT